MYHTLSGVVEEGFQTWGIGKRFACVPTHLGNSWFAAISCHPPMSLHHEAPWGDRGGALLNGSFSVTAEEFEKIRGPLLEWHSPIPQLLNNADSSSVTCTYAYATPEPVAGMCSHDRAYYL